MSEKWLGFHWLQNIHHQRSNRLNDANAPSKCGIRISKNVLINWQIVHVSRLEPGLTQKTDGKLLTISNISVTGETVIVSDNLVGCRAH